ncbi:MAG: RNA methyltransferase [Helcococcus sp.]|nr:RNA methyltransferase [Helcococcus sp.]
MRKYKKYSKKEEYTYAQGAFPTWELIRSGRKVEMIFIDDKFTDKDRLVEELNKRSIPYEIAPNQIRKLSNKENTYVIGIFPKENKEILEGKNHIILHDISDMGNLGTIIRSMLAFGVKDLALIGNVVDIYNPKVIRASMGAIFKIRFSIFNDMDEYIEKYNNNLYLFMLSNDIKDSIYDIEVKRPFTLVMGNEGAGLPEEFEKYGRKVFIPQSKDVDSLNLPIATSIGLYEFRRKYEINSI